MRIAQVAPLYESVPPTRYGGTERVVSYLTEELVRQGHEVTLFASGDSLTEARLVPVCKQSLRLAPGCIDPLAHHVLLVERVLDEKENFDLIHFHIDYLHYPRSRNENVVALTTLHGRLDIADLVPLYRRFRDVPVVSISDSQREPLPWLNWQGTVYHGLPIDEPGISAATWKISRVSGPHLSGKGPGRCDCDCPAGWRRTEDCRQDRSCGPGLF